MPKPLCHRGLSFVDRPLIYGVDYVWTQLNMYQIKVSPEVRTCALLPTKRCLNHFVTEAHHLSKGSTLPDLFHRLQLTSLEADWSFALVWEFRDKVCLSFDSVWFTKKDKIVLGWDNTQFWEQYSDARPRFEWTIRDYNAVSFNNYVLSISTPDPNENSSL